MNPRHDGVVGCDRLDFALSSPPESDAGAARVVPLAGRGRQQGDAIGADLRRPAPAPPGPPAPPRPDRPASELQPRATTVLQLATWRRGATLDATAPFCQSTALDQYDIGAQPALGDAPIQSGPAIGPYAALQAMALIEGLPVIHAPIWDSRVIRASQTHSLHFPPVTSTSPPTDLLDEARRALEPAFRLDNLVALSAERALYHAWDRVLKRPLAVRVHLDASGNPGCAWFLRESDKLAELDC